MTLVSRFGFLTKRFCNVNMLCLRNYSFQNQSRILTSVCPMQKYVSSERRSVSSDGDSKQKIETSRVETVSSNKLSQRARFKQAIRDYGATIIVFHVAISLTSLGICYIAVSNGVDALALLSRLGFPESVISSKVAVEGSTFVMSYAVHKLFAPVRIGITLSCAPLIVRYLRKKNILKPPK